MNKIQQNILYSTKREEMDLQLIFTFIKNSYWGSFRTFEEQKLAIDHSLSFGLFKEEKQIAFACVMTDCVFFAYLLDVFVID
tara:strand:+ start:685 stop:930 length:246 start_codon:yes stop_codon:yes gene_type:complete